MNQPKLLPNQLDNTLVIFDMSEPDFSNADYYFTFDAVALKDYDRASKFFITHCGSNSAAKEYLENGMYYDHPIMLLFCNKLDVVLLMLI